VTGRNLLGVTLRGERVEVHGHRGARGLRPENTLPGFAHALELGVDAVELDVGLTADGVVVLNHDQALSADTVADTAPVRAGDPLFPYVGRTIGELTLAQVKTVDASARRADPAGDVDAYLVTQVPVRGTRLPTLSEVCGVLAAYGAQQVKLAIELKTDPSWPGRRVEEFVAAVAEVLDSFGMTRQARFLGFDWRVLVAARDQAPDAGRVALIESKTLVYGSPWLAGMDPADATAAAVAVGATALSPEDGLVTTQLVHDAHGLGLPVTVWTVNDPAEMARFIEYGVDAIVTDYPDRLRRVLAEHGLTPPEPLRARRTAPAS
jgi:glycerophosphoryl diester phosphodiesterase